MISANYTIFFKLYFCCSFYCKTVVFLYIYVNKLLCPYIFIMKYIKAKNSFRDLKVFSVFIEI